jgi:hypothetical protein
MISKNLITAFVSLCFLFTIYVIVISFGLYLTIFSVVLIPAVIMHVYAIIKAHRNQPKYNLWMILSALSFLAFSLFRPDADQHGDFSGYTALMYHLGGEETEHATPWAYSLELSLLFLLAQIFLDTYILRGFGKIPR